MKRIFAFAIVMLVITVCLPLQSETAKPATLPIAESWIAAWNSHDPAKWATYFTPDIYYEDVTFGEISRGSAEAGKFAGSLFTEVPDLKLELVEAHMEGNHGSIQWVLTGTDKGVYKTGKPFKVRGVSVIAVKNGKISRSLDYYDLATIMRQVGVLPAS
ncbi:MAG: ester cyclase [Acidobacteria bacterium]|nr:ester cyclase [Acidobacteriota bacterium]MBS1865205.1 ester cyclase [Acidobacteriota bacterium]